MKVAFGAMLTLLLISTLTFAVNTQSVKANPETIVVPDHYRTIGWAIGNASAGDTITVKKGTYYENTITINKQLSIIASSAGEVNIIANQGQLFSVNSHNVTIQGLNLKNINGYGISARESDNLNIFYNTIEGNSLSTDAAGISIGERAREELAACTHGF